MLIVNRTNLAVFVVSDIDSANERYILVLVQRLDFCMSYLKSSYQTFNGVGWAEIKKMVKGLAVLAKNVIPPVKIYLGVNISRVKVNQSVMRWVT